MADTSRRRVASAPRRNLGRASRDGSCDRIMATGAKRRRAHRPCHPTECGRTRFSHLHALIRRCRRYLRLIDPIARIWFHSLDGDQHEANRTTALSHHTHSRNRRRRAGALVLASTSARRADTAVHAANVGPVATPTAAAAADASGSDIRPFRVSVPEAALVDLRRRIAATQWPERETVADASQGVQLATIQELARYWATEYDWRKGEEAECPPAIHHRNRWPGHSFHSRSIET